MSPHELLTKSDKDTEDRFRMAMLLNNVFTVHSGGALSFMHLDSSTIDTIKNAYQKSFEMLNL